MRSCRPLESLFIANSNFKARIFQYSDVCQVLTQSTCNKWKSKDWGNMLYIVLALYSFMVSRGCVIMLPCLPKPEDRTVIQLKFSMIA